MAGFVEKFQRMWNPPDDEYEDYYEEEQTEIKTKRVAQDYSPDESTSRRSSLSSISGYSQRADHQNKVVDMYAKAKLQVVLFKPVSFGEETRAIADELLERHTVVLNLERTERDVARRIVDFLSGVAYANNGKIKRIATNTFIITPFNVDLTGDDLLDELENSGVYF